MGNKLAQLILTPGRNSGSTCDIFIAQPDSLKESLAGKLFILVEIDSRKTESLKIINFLIDNINHSYYQNEKILLREKVEFLKVEHIFESVLSKVNKNFSEYLRNEKIKTDLRFINITVGLIHENMFYFSNTGNNKVFFIYKEKNHDNKKTDNINNQNNPYKIINIAKQATDNKKKNKDASSTNNNKLFSDVISGKIPEKGYFAITNEALPEYISDKQLMQILSSLPPASAVEHIKNLLSNINSYIPFLAIIIKNTTLEKTEEKETRPITSHDSFSDLNRTEENTENLLTPSGIVSFKRWLKFPPSLLPKKNETGQKQIILKDKIFTKKKNRRFFAINQLLYFIKNIFLFFVNITIFFKKLIAERKNINSIFADIKSKLKDKTQLFISSSKNLNKKNKILLIAAILFLLVFSINLMFIKTTKEKKQQEEVYNQLVAAIDQKQNQVEANLLYNNEDNAKKILDEIFDLLESFPQNDEKEKAQYLQFNNKFITHQEKLRHVTNIEDPNELANFTNLNNNAQPDNVVFIPEKNKLYAADSSQKSIYIFDTTDKTVTTLTDTEKPLVSLKFPSITKNNSIYYLNASDIIEFDIEEESFKNVAIDLKYNSEEYSGAESYSNNLYLLHAASNQIEKYSKSGQRFSAPTLWIADNLDLNNATDISIDGHIYILEKNGQIIKLLKGERVDLNLEKIDPGIEQAEKLFISPDQKFIYILEPTKNRLILFDKTGKFLMQYKSDKLKNLKDFVIDEKNGIIYFLNNTSIFSIEATHLTQ